VSRDEKMDEEPGKGGAHQKALRRPTRWEEEGVPHVTVAGQQRLENGGSGRHWTAMCRACYCPK
jgi:hypothetical protein